MRTFHRKRLLQSILAAAMLCLPVGCGNVVVENRAIRTAPNGSAAGFQHGRDGVFVKYHKSGELKKIFTPGDDVLATSSPRWSADGKQLIFTTAKPVDTTKPKQLQQPWDSMPSGRFFAQQAVVYTCWLYAKPKEGTEAKPIRLFDARCDHVGYIAADLAVRWNPSGESVVHIDRVSDNKHGVFEFHVRTKRSIRLFPHAADVLLFDWSPDGSHIACVVGNAVDDTEMNGIWIAAGGADDWWRIPESEHLAGSEHLITIPVLQAARPVWSRDSKKLLFAMNLPSPKRIVTVDNDATIKRIHIKNIPSKSRLYRVNVSTRATKLLAESKERFRDIHWSPDGKKFGYIGEKSKLFLYNLKTAESRAVVDEPVSRFAGWNRSGDSLAYVVPEQISRSRQDRWALLLVENRLARDAVYVTDGEGRSPGRVVFSGMRITFPQWSDVDQLTLWATFTPSHRFWIFGIFGGGLRPGDPAAVLHVKTGKMTWMAINAGEQAQVGHYYFLKHRYAEARRWYDRAFAGTPPSKPTTLAQFFGPRQGIRNFAFFHYLCLKKLGLDNEARVKLAEYQKSIQFNLNRNEKSDADFLNSRTVPGRRQSVVSMFRLMEDSYRAEVFCSLNEFDEGREFFERQLKTGQSSAARLSSAIVLSQFLLLAGKHEGYAKLATERIAPNLIEILKSQQKPNAEANNTRRPDVWSPVTIGRQALLPMFAEKFLATIPDARLQALLPKWRQLRQSAGDNTSRLAVDLFFRAAYQQLGRMTEYKKTEKLIQANPARRAWFPDGDLDRWIKQSQRNSLGS